MTGSVPHLLADSSVVVKWKLTTEPHATEARELFLDWEHAAVKVCVPDQLFAEVESVLLKACRRVPPVLSVKDAKDAVAGLLGLPFTVYETTGRKLALRSFDIAHRYNQRAYDCMYVALAERKGIDFWTGDERLYNALHADFPFVRWIAHYQRKRP